MNVDSHPDLVVCSGRGLGLAVHLNDGNGTFNSVQGYALYRNPEHPYTRKLLAAIPSSDPDTLRARFADADPDDAR